MDRKTAVARCHEIQLAIRDKEVIKFEKIPEIGMAVQLALHIRGLPIIEYQLLKMVATSLIGIPRLAVDRIVFLLAEIGFVKIHSEGKSIKAVLPSVPYFEDLYDGIGEYYENQSNPDEFEKLSLIIVDSLAGSPFNIDSLADKLGADRKDFDQSIEIGERGNYIYSRRCRSKKILLNPTYFSENADIFADHVAKAGAKTVQKTLHLLEKAQGWPLSLILKRKEIAGHSLSDDETSLIKRLAQDGMVKPPSIITSYSGDNSFIFTPTPNFVNISPFKREQYERALAIVSAIRQGELLPNKYRIRSPGAVLYKLKTELKLSPTSDYAEQYQNLQHLRIAKLVKLHNGYNQLEIIDTPENRESLKIAYQLVQGDKIPELVVDNDVMKAMAGTRDYVESLVSSKLMREKENISLTEETENELTQLLLEKI